jgi:hypothetical protein
MIRMTRNLAGDLHFSMTFLDDVFPMGTDIYKSKKRSFSFRLNHTVASAQKGRERSIKSTSDQQFFFSIRFRFTGDERKYDETYA